MHSRIALVRASGGRFISSMTACVTCSRFSMIIGFGLRGRKMQEVEEVKEVEEVEERKNRPGANGWARFYPLLPLPPLLPSLPFTSLPLRLLYLGVVEIPPAGFLIA